MMQRVFFVFFEEIEDLQSSQVEQDNISQHKDSVLVQINLFG